MAPRCTVKAPIFLTIASSSIRTNGTSSLTRRRVLRAATTVLCLTTMLVAGGCGIAPANLVGTTPKPISPECITQPKAVIEKSQSGPDRLQSSLERVRTDKFFHHIVIPAASDFPALATEATRLVDIARTQAADALATTEAVAARTGQSARTDQPIKSAITVRNGSLAPSDEVETALLKLLPWAGTMDPIQQSAEDIANKASNILSDASENARRINTLFPRNEQASSEEADKPAQNGPIASFNVVEHRQIFHNLTTLASFRAFHVLALLSAAHLHELLKAEPPAKNDDLDAETRVFNITRFLSAYFDAYFRGGQFLQVTFDEKDFVATLATRIQKQFPKPVKVPPTAEEIATLLQPAFAPPDEKRFVRALATDFYTNLAGGNVGSLTPQQIQNLLQPAFDNLCKQAGPTSSTCLSTSMGNSAFVTRAGLSVQFSGVSFEVGGKDSIGISHTYPQVSNFGPQLIRVFVEALFDANGQHLPAVPNSTACDPANHLFQGDECVVAGSPQDLRRQQIDMISAGAEALSSSETGVIIRGLGWTSLNNEVVASILETLVGVNARKISEKVLYSVSEKLECPLTTAALHVAGD